MESFIIALLSVLLFVLVGKDDCLFDGQGMCFWQDSSSSSYNWKRIKGRTPSGRTGPEGDHSTMKSTKDGKIPNNII